MRLRGLILVLVALAAGVAVGAGIAHIHNARQISQQDQQKSLLGHAILEGTERMRIGEPVQDHLFLDAQSSQVWLSDLCHEVTVICIVDPECEQCVEELIALPLESKGLLDADRFIIVSAASPSELSSIRSQAKFDGIYLHDFRGEWMSQNKLTVFPCNLFVTSEMKLAHVVVGQLSRRDLVKGIQACRSISTDPVSTTK